MSAGLGAVPHFPPPDQIQCIFGPPSRVMQSSRVPGVIAMSTACSAADRCASALSAIFLSSAALALQTDSFTRQRRRPRGSVHRACRTALIVSPSGRDLAGVSSRAASGCRWPSRWRRDVARPCRQSVALVTDFLVMVKMGDNGPR